MKGLLADAHLHGHLQAVVYVLESPAWSAIWQSLGLKVYRFADLSLAPDASDALIWRECQQSEVALITANRNAAGLDSLEATLRSENTTASLPVFTVADPDALLQSKDYAERVAIRLLEYLLDIDDYRGSGRLYLP
jgi:hypothetical protein